MRIDRPGGLLVCAALAVALGGCRSTRLPLPDHPRNFAGVRMLDVSFHSAALGRDVSYRVYLPDQIAADAKLPVVYLLHGNGGGSHDWSNWSDAGQYAAKGLILVMPDGDSSYWMNERLAPREKYEDYFLKDLIPDVESCFPARRDREGRAIVGVSMGGFAAMRLALVRPDLFAYVAGISPAIDVPSRKLSIRRWSQSMRFRTIFGSDGSAERRAADPFVLVKSAEPETTPYLYVTSGRDEPLREPIERFARDLKARGFTYEFHELPGAHTWTQWDQQIPWCFDALQRVLGVGSNPKKNQHGPSHVSLCATCG